MERRKERARLRNRALRNSTEAWLIDPMPQRVAACTEEIGRACYCLFFFFFQLAVTTPDMPGSEQAAAAAAAGPWRQPLCICCLGCCSIETDTPLSENKLRR